MRTKPMIQTLMNWMLRGGFAFLALAALFNAWATDLTPETQVTAWKREFFTEMGVGVLLLLAVAIVPHEKLYKYSYIIPILLLIFAFALMILSGVAEREFWKSFLMTIGSGIFLYVGFDYFITQKLMKE